MYKLNLPKLHAYLDRTPIGTTRRDPQKEIRERDLQYKRQQVASLRDRLRKAEAELAALESHSTEEQGT